VLPFEVDRLATFTIMLAIVKIGKLGRATRPRTYGGFLGQSFVRQRTERVEAWKVLFAWSE